MVKIHSSHGRGPAAESRSSRRVSHPGWWLTALAWALAPGEGFAREITDAESTVIYERHAVNAVRRVLTLHPENLDAVRTIVTLSRTRPRIHDETLRAVGELVIEARGFAAKSSDRGPETVRRTYFLRVSEGASRLGDATLQHRVRAAFLTTLVQHADRREFLTTETPWYEEVRAWFPEGVRADDLRDETSPGHAAILGLLRSKTPLRLPRAARVEDLLTSNPWYASEETTRRLRENDQGILSHVGSVKTNPKAPATPGLLGSTRRAAEHRPPKEASAVFQSSATAIDQLGETLIESANARRGLQSMAQFLRLADRLQIAQFGENGLIRAAATLDAITIGLQFAQLYLDTPGAANAEVLQAIAELAQDMHDRFDKLENRLGKMHQEVMLGLERLDQLIGDVLTNQATILKSLQNVQEQSARIERSVNEAQKALFQALAEDRVGDFETLLGTLDWGPGSQRSLLDYNTVRDGLTKLVLEATEFSRMSVHVGVDPNLLYSEASEVPGKQTFTGLDESAMVGRTVEGKPGTLLEGLLRLETLLYGLPAPLSTRIPAEGPQPWSGRLPSATHWKRSATAYLRVFARTKSRAFLDQLKPGQELHGDVQMEQILKTGLELRGALEFGRDRERIKQLVSLRQQAYAELVEQIEQSWVTMRRRHLLGREKTFPGLVDELGPIQGEVRAAGSADPNRLAVLDERFPASNLHFILPSETQRDGTMAKLDWAPQGVKALPLNEEGWTSVTYPVVTLRAAQEPRVPARMAEVLPTEARVWLELREQLHTKKILPAKFSRPQVTFLVDQRWDYRSNNYEQFLKTKNGLRFRADAQFEIHASLAETNEPVLGQSSHIGSVGDPAVEAALSPTFNFTKPRSAKLFLTMISLDAWPGEYPRVPGPVAAWFWDVLWDHTMKQGKGQVQRTLNAARGEAFVRLIETDVRNLREEFLSEIVRCLRDSTEINTTKTLLLDYGDAKALRQRFLRLDARDRLLLRHMQVFTPDLRKKILTELTALPSTRMVLEILDSAVPGEHPKQNASASAMRERLERLNGVSQTHQNLLKKLTELPPHAFEAFTEEGWEKPRENRVDPNEPNPTMTVETVIGLLTDASLGELETHGDRKEDGKQP